MNQTFVGIDVGGARKGFHAVLVCDGRILGKKAERDPDAMATWCLENEASVVAVDAPCRWSVAGKSREAERELNRQRLHCYYTPTRAGALNRSFYQWVFNGEKLYRALGCRYPLFSGPHGGGRVCFETFPHAVVCALEGRVVPARPKNITRRTVLQRRGFDVSMLSCIDFVDAALCALAAEAFHKNNFKVYGDSAEGLIVVPS